MRVFHTALTGELQHCSYFSAFAANEHKAINLRCVAGWIHLLLQCEIYLSGVNNQHTILCQKIKIQNTWTELTKPVKPRAVHALACGDPSEMKLNIPKYATASSHYQQPLGMVYLNQINSG